MSFKLKTFPFELEEQSIFDWQLDTYTRMTNSDISPLFIKDLGGWDMVADATFTVTLPTLQGNSIDRIDLLIIKDDQLSAKDASFGTGIFDIEIDYVTNTIAITRLGGGVYDSTDYDDDTVNRGRIRLWT